MDHLPKELFFAVWDLPELRSLIRSFMWPGRRSATWYGYRDILAAARNGYNDLLAMLWQPDVAHDVLKAAACSGKLSTVELADNLHRRYYYKRAMYAAIRKGTITKEVLGYLADKVSIDPAKALNNAIKSKSLETCKLVYETIPSTRLPLTVDPLIHACDIDVIQWCSKKGLIRYDCTEPAVVCHILRACGAHSVVRLHEEFGVRYTEEHIQSAIHRQDADVIIALENLGYAVRINEDTYLHDPRVIAWACKTRKIALTSSLVADTCEINKYTGESCLELLREVEDVDVTVRKLIKRGCKHSAIWLIRHRRDKIPQHAVLDDSIGPRLMCFSLECLEKIELVYTINVGPALLAAAIETMNLKLVQWACERFTSSSLSIDLAVVSCSYEITVFICKKYSELTPIRRSSLANVDRASCDSALVHLSRRGLIIDN